MPESNLPALIEQDAIVTDDGERVPLALVGVDDIASWIEQLRETKSVVDTCIAALSAEAVRRADASAATEIGGTQRFVRVTGPALVPRYDPQKLARVLLALVHDGVLTHEAVRGVVTSERVWKVDTTRMKKLAKLPRVADRIKDVALPGEEPVRRVTTVGWLQ
jgi:hypothetical protein